MLINIFFLHLALYLPCGSTVLYRRQGGAVPSRSGSCIPNTQFRVNGRICFCDGLGRWSETTCEVTRRKTCKPGQIIWEDCSQCICQEDSQLLCTNTACDKTIARSTSTNEIDITKVWCMPFVSYYVNCSLCVCPASGRMAQARCARDASCPFKGASADMQMALQKRVCIPKVMYLFPCFQCHCSDDGYFSAGKCVETCRKPLNSDSTRRCIPNTFYREDCNICPCPRNGLVNAALCSKAECNNRFQLLPLENLRNVTSRCHRHTFTSPKCYYCECKQHGNVDENACFESECISTVKYDYARNTCSPGEMVPICTQCFCLRNGLTSLKFCTKVCSHQHKLMVLDVVIKESISDHLIIDKGLIKKAESNRICEPNSIYLDEGKFCLCPDNGVTDFKLCISDEDFQITKGKEIKPVIEGINLDAPCDPSTFAVFDCNTCYCPKTGKLDPKWCTYDDCEEKRIIQESHKKPSNGKIDDKNGTCIPGSISYNDCNFCICGENGLLKNRSCTKNKCDVLDPSSVNLEKFTCEPLTYYSIDCNICYCPRNGLKNLEKCTKNICEKNFLRSDVCIAGDLFTEDCNVCVCPPNGDKSEKVCTKKTCLDSDTPWKRILQLSHTLSSGQASEDSTRNLELCFPGEEFEIGCKVCVCPDMGLRLYADCTPMLCDDEKNKETSDSEDLNATDRKHRLKRQAVKGDDEKNKETSDSEDLYATDRKHQLKRQAVKGDDKKNKETNDSEDLNATDRKHRVKRQAVKENCRVVDVTNSAERKECTPGSMYIIRCQQCICPYMGNINWFCRPMPQGVYCEQAFPGINYMINGRRNPNTTSIASNETSTTSRPPHTHTFYSCDKPDHITDDCFVCECQNNYIIEEHCFRNEARDCSKRRPTFLNKEKMFLD